MATSMAEYKVSDPLNTGDKSMMQVIRCMHISLSIIMCRCEGYGFQAVYSRIEYINPSVWV